MNQESEHDLVVTGADLVVTMSGDEIANGWVAITDGMVSGIGEAGTAPSGRRTLDASGCLVTPGLINTHHHMFQNLSRAYGPAVNASIGEWVELQRDIWGSIDEESAYLSAWVAFAELLLGGCTMTTDDLFLHPRPRLVDATIKAAQETGIRFHPVRDGNDLSLEEDGILPASLVEDPDEILADADRLIDAYHDPSPSARIRIGVSACGLWGSSLRLFEEVAAFAERRRVRLFTHLLESPVEEEHVRRVTGRRPTEALEEAGWGSANALFAHMTAAGESDIERVGAWGAGVAHCPSSGAIVCEGITPVTELRAAGARVGLGCDGSASCDHSSMWLEARAALLLGKLRGGPSAMSARDVMRMATADSAACLGREGEAGRLVLGHVGDLVAWPIGGPAFSGAVTDPVEALLRCGPVSARHTVVAGEVLVRDGQLVTGQVDDIVRRHGQVASALQGVSGNVAATRAGE